MPGALGHIAASSAGTSAVIEVRGGKQRHPRPPERENCTLAGRTVANKNYRLVCRQPKPNQVILILYGAQPALQGGRPRKRRGHYGQESKEGEEGEEGQSEEVSR